MLKLFCYNDIIQLLNSNLIIESIYVKISSEDIKIDYCDLSFDELKDKYEQIVKNMLKK